MKYILLSIVAFMVHLATAQQKSGLNVRNIDRIINKTLETDQFTLKELHQSNEYCLIKEIWQDDRLMGFLYLNRVSSCRAGSCPLPEESNSEYFDYLILYDTKGTVKTVRIFNYAATHGQQVASTGWLRQFSGFKGEEKKQVGKNVDAIAGATISANAITEDINRATTLIKEVINQ